ncbi:MAG TPA: cystathionine gamma-synthase [Gemmatimonadaceae bacterium]|nr:cystathionine gamma-synthase [Gemmatimonadaceae bacterium]
MSDTRSFAATTRAVRAGIARDREHGAVVPPIHLSATFAFEGFNKPRRFDYTRSGNPTRSQLADALAELEGGAVGVVTNTGMSAVTLALQLLDPGQTIVAAHDCYGGTQRLLRSLAKRGHFNLVPVNLTSADAPAAIAANAPRIVWIETPSNPLLRITDIRAIAKAGHDAGAVVVVDNTFLSPALQQPIALGADVVVHSTTKYINGHSDVVGGAVIAADQALGEELAWWANCLGVTGAPFDSYLTLRGLRTLHARLRDHLANAAAVVDALTRHPAVRGVYYPGLESHPGHELARAQQQGFGAMVSFELVGGTPSVQAFVEQLQCFSLAESLGGVESLVAHPASMTHVSMDADARAVAGISESLVRLSVGIESADDLVADVVAGLDEVSRLRPERSSSHPERSASHPERSEGSAPLRVDVQIPRFARDDRSGARDDRSGARDDRADVVILGPGSIGRELIAQLTANDSPLRVAGLIDRSGYVFSEGGLPAARLAELCAVKAAGQPLSEAIDGHSASALSALQAIASQRLVRPILVDSTAADTDGVLNYALTTGFDLVLANKVPLAASQDVVDRLQDVARQCRRRIFYEATVGAGLPVIDTLRKLIEAGDEVLRIEGCPSGTLGFLFGALVRGEAFSEALRRAIALRYSEPDPRIDLSGVDVARKALILARTIGFRGELAEDSIESLVPKHLAHAPLDEFLDRLPEFDDSWSKRVNDARRKGRVLRYRAHATPTGVAVGLVSVKISEPLATLTGTDNQFTFTTKRYREQPLVITGPGAGPAVTAAGVFNDLLHVERTTRERSPSPESEYARELTS